jgi:hypothetical protein
VDRGPGRVRHRPSSRPVGRPTVARHQSRVSHRDTWGVPPTQSSEMRAVRPFFGARRSRRQGAVVDEVEREAGD